MEKLAAERLGGVSGPAEIRRALSRARIVVLLEGPGFLTSGFFLVETDFLDNLGVVERYAATKVFRIPIRHVNEKLVPEPLRAIAPAWRAERPLADLTVPQRDAAMAKIIDGIVEAFWDWRPPPRTTISGGTRRSGSSAATSYTRSRSTRSAFSTGR